jgi:hypothetical protein
MKTISKILKLMRILFHRRQELKIMLSIRIRNLTVCLVYAYETYAYAEHTYKELQLLLGILLRFLPLMPRISLSPQK